MSPLTVYPNPTRDKVFVGEVPTEPMMVYNMQGQCVLQLPAGTRTIEMQELPQGVYFLRVGSRSAKIVKR